MTDKTINNGDDLGTTPASGDFFAIWDLDAAQQKKVSYADLLGATLTGGGTIATGGFTFTIPATGTAALATGLSGGQTIYGGTEAADDLTLEGTSNATPGTLIIQPDGGNVVVGASSGSGKFHVLEGSSGATANASWDTAVIESSSNTGLTILAPDSDASSLQLGNVSDSTSASFQFVGSTDVVYLGGNKAGVQLSLRSGNASDAIRIDANQKVGIGTTAPGQILDVNQGSGNMIADGYDNHSLLEYKEEVRDVPISGALDRLSAVPFKMWKRKPFVSTEELVAEARELFDIPEDVDAREWYKSLASGSEEKVWVDAKRNEMRELRRQMPQWQRIHLGIIADDPTTIQKLPNVVSRNEDGKIVGISLNEYVGVLHAALLDLENQVRALQQ